jgi:hypothetical protein
MQTEAIIKAEGGETGGGSGRSEKSQRKGFVPDGKG